MSVTEVMITGGRTDPRRGSARYDECKKLPMHFLPSYTPTKSACACRLRPKRDQDKPVEEQANQTLGKKVEAFQGHMREMGDRLGWLGRQGVYVRQDPENTCRGKFMYAPCDSRISRTLFFQQRVRALY